MSLLHPSISAGLQGDGASLCCFVARVRWTLACAFVLLCSCMSSSWAQASDMPASATAASDSVAAAQVPIADAGRSLFARASVPVILDGSKSRDPSGLPLGYAWTLVEAPAGSLAVLDASDPSPAFVPDAAGLYLFKLVVNKPATRSRIRGSCTQVEASALSLASRA